MIPQGLNEGVQFTVDGNNHVTAVVVAPGLWRSIIRALEESEEREFVEALKGHQIPPAIDISALLLSSANEDWA